jgi:hypothetical protein
MRRNHSGHRILKRVSNLGIEEATRTYYPNRSKESSIKTEPKYRLQDAIHRLFSTPPHPQQEELERIHLESMRQQGYPIIDGTKK